MRYFKLPEATKLICHHCKVTFTVNIAWDDESRLREAILHHSDLCHADPEDIDIIL